MGSLIGIPCYSDKLSTTGAVRFWMGQSYCRALAQADGTPVLIPLLENERFLDQVIRSLDGLLLAGGGDVDPQHYGHERLTVSTGVDLARDWVELRLVRLALARDVPILAICRGIQVLNVACGGTLYQDVPAQVDGSLRHSYAPDNPRNHLGHHVDVHPESKLARILGRGMVPVNSFHHQAIRVVGDGLMVSAVSEDGIIEAVEMSDRRFVLGVQWHPEELVDDDPRMAHLFAALVGASRGETP